MFQWVELLAQGSDNPRILQDDEAELFDPPPNPQHTPIIIIIVMMIVC